MRKILVLALVSIVGCTSTSTVNRQMGLVAHSIMVHSLLIYPALQGPYGDGSELLSDIHQLRLLAAVIDDDADAALQAMSDGADPYAPRTFRQSYLFTRYLGDDASDVLTWIPPDGQVSFLIGNGYRMEWDGYCQLGSLRLLRFYSSRFAKTVVILDSEWITRISAGRPLSLAGCEGSRKVLEAFKGAGIDIDRPSENGRTALMLAAECGSLDGVTWLVENGANVVAADHEGEAPIHWAARGGDHAVVDYLLSQGVWIESPTGDGRTPLMVASSNDKVSAIEFLLGSGADLHARDHGNRSALMLAARDGATDAISCLIAHGLPMNEVDGEGKSPLMYAAEANTTGSIEALVELGADMDWQNHEGLTALMHAVTTGRTANVEAVLLLGARRSLKNEDALTARNLAEKSGRRDILTLFRWLNRVRIESKIGMNLSKISHVGQSIAPGVDLSAGVSVRLNDKIALVNDVAFILRDSGFDSFDTELPEIEGGYDDLDVAFEFTSFNYRPALRLDLGRRLRNHPYVFAGGNIGSVVGADVLPGDSGTDTPEARSVKEYAKGTTYGWLAGAGYAWQSGGGWFVTLESQYARDFSDAFQDWSGGFSSWSFALSVGR